MRTIILVVMLMLALAGSVSGETPTPLPTPTPAVTPTPTIAPTVTPTPTEVATIQYMNREIPIEELNFEQLLQLRQWEQDNRAVSSQTTLAVIGAVIAIGVLTFTGWRTYAFQQQVREQMLASYRERLFSTDPAAVIAAALSLSAYPREAVWLVNRWAQEHEAVENTHELDKKEKARRQRVKQAIQDALDNMSKQKSWKYHGWITLERIKDNKLFSWLKIPYWERVQGARLDGKTISIDIGPIHLRNAYMVGADFRGIGLQGADLHQADLCKSDLRGASLEKTILREARLQKANLDGVDLHSTDLGRSDLRDAKLDIGILWLLNI